MVSELELRRGDTTIVTRISALILDFARIMVRQPDSMTIQSAATDSGITLTLRILKADLHLFIGHKGGTVSALRTILAAIGAKERMKVTLFVEAIE